MNPQGHVYIMMTISLKSVIEEKISLLRKEVY